MNKINFVTSNQGKIKTLENSIKLYSLDVSVQSVNLDIVEPQFDCIQEVSKFKALAAFEKIKEPVLVEDGGFCVEALNGFPGVYTKYVIKTLGVDGILKLMEGTNNRAARFDSVATFVDSSGSVFQFERECGDFEISEEKIDIDSPLAWSELWKIIYLKEYQKNLCQLSEKELSDFYEKNGKNGSIQKFVRWYAQNR